MANSVSVEVSPGELIDKITILEIKAARIGDPAKLDNIHYELGKLTAVRDDDLPASAALGRLTSDLRAINARLWDIEDEIRDCERHGQFARLTAELKQVNERLWEIEDDIRECERDKDFGDKFVELARGVYANNDKRSRLKRDINKLLGSRLIEEKSYAAY